jgi:WD40 repeat protein
MRMIKLRRSQRVGRLSFAPDGRRLAVVVSLVEDHVEEVSWVDSTSGETRQIIPIIADQCALSADHARVAVGFSPYVRPRGAALVRHAAVPAGEGEPAWINVDGLPHNHVFTLAFTPDGNRLAVGCSRLRSGRYDSDAVYTAPIVRGKPVTLRVEPFVGELAFSRDGRWLALTGGPRGMPAVRLHRYPDPEPAMVYTPRATRTRRLVFAPDRPVVAALAARLVILLEAGRPEPLAVLKGHKARVDDAAFTPDGRRLLTAGQDGTVRVWDSHTCQAAATFEWPVGKLTAVAVAPDGLTAAAAGQKGQIVVWDLDA